MDQLILKADINRCEFEGQINAGEVEARILTVEMCDRLCSCAMAFVTFELADGTVYESKVERGKAKLPVFEKSQFIKIGLYSADIENGECVKRYSPKPASACVNVGSYKEGATEPPLPTPGDYAELLEMIKNSGSISVNIIQSLDLDLETEYSEKDVPSAQAVMNALVVLAELFATNDYVDGVEKSVKTLETNLATHIEQQNSINGGFIETHNALTRRLDALEEDLGGIENGSY